MKRALLLAVLLLPACESYGWQSKYTPITPPPDNNGLGVLLVFAGNAAASHGR